MSWTWGQLRKRAADYVAENGDGLDREPPVTQQELRDNYIPLEYRDYCAHLLIPLNRCRNDTGYAPWKCGEQRHAYEACQFGEYVRVCARVDEPCVAFSFRCSCC